MVKEKDRMFKEEKKITLDLVKHIDRRLTEVRVSKSLSIFSYLQLNKRIRENL